MVLVGPGPGQTPFWARNANAVGWRPWGALRVGPPGGSSKPLPNKYGELKTKKNVRCFENETMQQIIYLTGRLTSTRISVRVFFIWRKSARFEERHVCRRFFLEINSKILESSSISVVTLWGLRNKFRKQIIWTMNYKPSALKKRQKRVEKNKKNWQSWETPNFP